MSVNEQRVVVLGNGGVGKSSLTIRLITDNFMEEYDPTIEDTYQKTLVVDGESTVLNVLDTAGQEEYSSMQDQWMREGRAFLLVYSVTQKRSFEALNKLREKIIRVKQATNENSIPIILVGNKIDLSDEREVSTEMGKVLAGKWRCPFFETSAKTKVNSLECFNEAVRVIRAANNREEGKGEKPKPKKRSFCVLL